MRRGEMAALKFSEVDWSHQKNSVNRASSESNGKIIVKAPKTKSGCRQVVFDAKLIELLCHHRGVMDELRANLGQDWNAEGWLFVSIKGKVLAPRALNARFAGRLKRAGLSGKGYELHTLRHTHLSQLLTLNLPPLLVSRRAGHSSVATTMNLYGHLISQFQ